MGKVGVRAALAAMMVAGLIVAGCGQPGDKDKPKADKADKAKAEGDKAKETKVAKEEEKGKHEGWWCDDHGIPEKECSLCSQAVEKEAKAKGDWCNKHNRALSQCFYCNPDRRAFYAAQYKAKYGKEPPSIPEFDEKKDKKEKEKDKK